MLPPPNPWAITRFGPVPKIPQIGKICEGKNHKSLTLTEYRFVVYHLFGIFMPIKDLDVI